MRKIEQPLSMGWRWREAIGCKSYRSQSDIRGPEVVESGQEYSVLIWLSEFKLSFRVTNFRWNLMVTLKSFSED